MNKPVGGSINELNGIAFDFQKSFKLPEPMDKSLSLLRGEDWRRIRTTLSPSFSAHKLKGMIPLMNLACDTLVKKIDQVAEAGGSFDIVRYIIVLMIGCVVAWLQVSWLCGGWLQVS